MKIYYGLDTIEYIYPDFKNKGQYVQTDKEMYEPLQRTEQY